MKGFSEVSAVDMEKVDGGDYSVSSKTGGSVTIGNGGSYVVTYSSSGKVTGYYQAASNKSMTAYNI